MAKFRQGPLKNMADTESMFYQVLVAEKTKVFRAFSGGKMANMIRQLKAII